MVEGGPEGSHDLITALPGGRGTGAPRSLSGRKHCILVEAATLAGLRGLTEGVWIQAR